MAEQLHLHPIGLTRQQFQRLVTLADLAARKQLAELLADVHDHLEDSRAAHAENRLVNLRLSEAIRQAIDRVGEQWERLPANARYWLGGAFRYFAKSHDDEPDFSSPIGFEDDAEVLNACLRFAGLKDLCLRVEDFDGG